MTDIKDPLWRLNNLYQIKGKTGEVIKFTPTPLQISYMQHGNLLTSYRMRQTGFTTMALLQMFDDFLFGREGHVGHICTTDPDLRLWAPRFLFDIYERLNPELKDALDMTASESNGRMHLYCKDKTSHISIGIPVRSGHLRYVFIMKPLDLSEEDMIGLDSLLDGHVGDRTTTIRIINR